MYGARWMPERFGTVRRQYPVQPLQRGAEFPQRGSDIGAVHGMSVTEAQLQTAEGRLVAVRQVEGALAEVEAIVRVPGGVAGAVTAKGGWPDRREAGASFTERATGWPRCMPSSCAARP
jgi:hypothetical protein